ncbi:diguanylate cyclase [Lysinibacillus sp. BW-2-10]|uniref:sensor domain-containing diguanylate cyclase n=1 Tax=Lysinibacillus sp. BW-2-10 TaxID=2590030 RepID=UPI0011802A38|nr:diguanylate cyclase [Lysinibacillus sp. BW-2-10]TSI07389.1 diguanylate cyclase [Lysinibacillus sp. BW-2-10]
MDKRLRKAPCGFISINHDCYIIEVNDTFLEWMGYKQADLLGKHIESLLKPGTKMIFHSYFYPNINFNGCVEELFIKVKNQAGDEVPYLLNAKKVKQGDSEIIDCILVQMKRRIDYELELRATKKQMEEAYIEKNIAFEKLEQIYLEIEKKQIELMEMNSDLVTISNTDKLTGITNRRFFQEKLEQQVDLYQKEGKPFSFLIIDIDHFKKVNDTYGHQIGDIVLVKLATILKNIMRLEDVVSRFGGEEFTVILPATDIEKTISFAKKINQEVEEATWQETGSLTVSIGAATFTEQDTEISIIEKADRALYASKENGRNRSTHFIEL